MSTRFRQRATLPAALAAAALAMGVLAPVAQAGPGYEGLWTETLENEATGTWYTSPNNGLGKVENRAPIFETGGDYETQFVTDAVSNNPCEVTFTVTNATNLPYFIVYRIDGETGLPGQAEWDPWDGRLGVTGAAASPSSAATRGHTWGFRDAVTSTNTVNLRDLADLEDPTGPHTIEYALAGPESDDINPDVSWDSETWKSVEVEGCATPPCPVCEDSGSLGSIAEGSLGSLEGGDGSLSDSAGSDGGVDGSLAALTGSLAGSVGSAAGSDEDGSLGDLTGSLSDSLGEGSLGAGSLTASLAPLGSTAGSLPLLIPVALIGGSLAAAPMIQQSLAGLNIQLPALPEFPPLAGSAMPAMPPIAAPVPAPGPPSPNGRG
ncbi:hypothetical protein SAMN06265174_10614 [Dietzia kunjamensis subsp. schimae]|uniref:Uncharacterized protein n=1 Tax=Dietzia kunjamensis subsp. schimae TaxID=498198 RepID=A0ABY1N312_9ACTN|nr:hypothetical protein [Dietzia kunjamensis]SMO78208.1 hypothetical protein SAMN06265174_10614 [Dietzia kunjamensis subsp. schimae]